jgi:hypothetical protein
MSRLLNYLTESFEDKLFYIIDNFMQQHNIPFKDIISGNYLGRLLNSFEDIFDVSIEVYVGNDKKYITGKVSLSPITITIELPNIQTEITYKDRLEFLSVLFHEIAHVRQLKPTNSNFDFEKYKKFSNNILLGMEYFLQNWERSPNAFYVAMGFLISDLNIVDITNKIKDIVNKFDNENEYIMEINRFFLSNYNTSVLEYITIAANILGFKHLKHHIDKTTIDRLKKLFDAFYKNLLNTYKKLKGYFERYNVLKEDYVDSMSIKREVNTAYTEIFVNPTPKEMRSLGDAVRFIIDFNNKKFYVWNANILHEEIMSLLYKKKLLKTSDMNSKTFWKYYYGGSGRVINNKIQEAYGTLDLENIEFGYLGGWIKSDQKWTNKWFEMSLMDLIMKELRYLNIITEEKKFIQTYYLTKDLS